jgi:hypothetical protein
MRFLYRTLYWFVPWWYSMSMRFTRRGRKNPEVANYTTTREIAIALNWGNNWRADPLKGAIDVVMHPRKFQGKIDAGDKGFGDCDDHALYWATALLKSGLADRAWLGTAWYVKAGDKRGVGHVVCVFEKDGKTFWADYRTPVEVGDSWAWAYSLVKSRNAELKAAGRMEVTLRRNGDPKIKKVNGKRYLP